MEKYVVTISRQFGSRGREIAKIMSRKLGIDFYDRDIVDATAKRMGLPVSEISDKEEKGTSRLITKLKYPLGTGLISTQQEIFYVQSNIIRDLGKSDESCIIVGRCADMILKDIPRCLNIYIYAPFDERVANLIESPGMEPAEARRSIHEVDRAREAYRLSYCDGVKTVLDLRDILIDSSRFGTEKTADILSNMVREVFAD